MTRATNHPTAWGGLRGPNRISTWPAPLSLLDELPWLVAVVDAIGVVRWWNRAVERTLERSQELLTTASAADLGLTVAEISRWAAAPDVPPLEHEWEAPLPAGGAVSLVGSARKLSVGDEGESGFMVFARDVTRRGATDTWLSEERFRTFMAHGPMVAFIKDGEGRHLYMNELMQLVDAEQIAHGWYGRTDFDFWPDDVAAKIRADDLVVLAGDEPREFVETVPMADGSHVWLTYKFPLPDPRAGRILGGMAIDITERVNAEAERARLAAAVEQTTDAVLVADSSTRVVYVNASFERMTGSPRVALLGEPSSILDNQPPRIRRAVRRALWSGRSWSGPLVLTRSDGTTLDTETTVSPVRDGDGRFVGYVAVSRDMSQVRALEEQLRQGQKMEAIGRLAGGIAHDFNNLLVAIAGYVHALLNSLSEEDPRRTDVEQIRLAAERAASLTGQLLAFSRQQILQPQLLDLNEVVRGIVPMLRRLLGETLSLETELTTAATPVFADPGQVGQVIVNLATNARDAMPDGGRLTIRTSAGAVDTRTAAARGVRSRSYVQLAFRDTGTGIDPTIRTRIFEPFFTTKPSGKGIGLGLATVYGIVEQSGGSIRVDTGPGEGTTFIIDFPLAAGPGRGSRGPAQPGDAWSGRRSSLEDHAAV